MAKSFGAIKIKISNSGGILVFDSINSLKDGKIIGKVPKYSKNVCLSFEENPILSFTLPSQNATDIINLMIEFLKF